VKILLLSTLSTGGERTENEEPRTHV